MSFVSPIFFVSLVSPGFLHLRNVSFYFFSRDYVHRDYSVDLPRCIYDLATIWSSLVNLNWQIEETVVQEKKNVFFLREIVVYNDRRYLL